MEYLLTFVIMLNDGREVYTHKVESFEQCHENGKANILTYREADGDLPVYYRCDKL